MEEQYLYVEKFQLVIYFVVSLILVLTLLVAYIVEGDKEALKAIYISFPLLTAIGILLYWSYKKRIPLYRIVRKR